MLKDELSSLREKREQKVVAKGPRRPILDDLIRSAKKKLKVAARAGSREAVVLSVSEFQDELIDLSGCYAGLEDSQEDWERAQQQIKSLSVSRLRGNAAQLRDYLAQEGLYLSLHHHVKGHGCKGSWNEWDLVARF